MGKNHKCQGVDHAKLCFLLLEKDFTSKALLPNPPIYLPFEIVSCVYDLAEACSQPCDVRYMALEILKQYFGTHHQTCLNEKNDGSKTDLDHWVPIKDPQNLVIYCLVAIRISSKVLLGPSSAPMYYSMKESLNKFQIKYNDEDIVVKEIELLAGIDYQLNISSLWKTIKTIQPILQLDQKDDELINDILSPLVDLIYSHEGIVYDIFYSKVTQEPFVSIEERIVCQTVETNKIFLGSSVIYTAHILSNDSQELAETVVGRLSLLTHIHSKDIQEMSRAIILTVL